MEADLENMPGQDSGASAWEPGQAQEKVRKSMVLSDRLVHMTCSSYPYTVKSDVSLLLLLQGHKERGRGRFCSSKRCFSHLAW